MKLNNIPLELDSRIYDIEDIKTVITADENDVGKMGYFANSIHFFKNLDGQDGIKYGKLIFCLILITAVINLTSVSYVVINGGIVILSLLIK